MGAQKHCPWQIARRPWNPSSIKFPPKRKQGHDQSVKRGFSHTGHCVDASIPSVLQAVREGRNDFFHVSGGQTGLHSQTSNLVVRHEDLLHDRVHVWRLPSGNQGVDQASHHHSLCVQGFGNSTPVPPCRVVGPRGLCRRQQWGLVQAPPWILSAMCGSLSRKSLLHFYNGFEINTSWLI